MGTKSICTMRMLLELKLDLKRLCRNFKKIRYEKYLKNKKIEWE